MMRRKQPKSLQELSERAFLNYLYEVICVWKNQAAIGVYQHYPAQVARMRAFIRSSLNPFILNDLMKMARRYLLEVPHNWDVYPLMMSTIMNEKTVEARFRTYLFAVCRSGEEILIACIANVCFHSLNLLELPKDCSNELLKTVAVCAPNLSQLYVTESKVNNTGLLSLCGMEHVCHSQTTCDGFEDSEKTRLLSLVLKLRICFEHERCMFKSTANVCSSLKVLDIRQDLQYVNTIAAPEMITQEGVAALLLCLPQLTVVETKLLNPAITTYKSIRDSESGIPCLKLTKYSDPLATEPRMSTVLAVCPDIKNVEVGINAPPPAVGFFTQFGQLTHLNMTSLFEHFSPSMQRYLEVYGHNLESLRLHLMSADHKDLKLIKESCSKLKRLELEIWNVGHYDLSQESDASLEELKCFVLKVMFIERDLLLFLLKNTPKVAVLQIIKRDSVPSHITFLHPYLDDAFFCDLISKYPNIQEVYVDASSLTAASLYYMLNNCPHIQHIGIITHWNIGNFEAHRLCHELKQQNVDICLHLSSLNCYIQKFCR